MADNGKDLYRVVTKAHRVSYVHLVEPSSFDENGTKKYSLILLIKKDHPDAAIIRDTIQRIYEENKMTLFGGLPLKKDKVRNPLCDGDEYVEDNPDAEGYAGHYYLKVSSKDRPTVFDIDGKELLDLSEVYSGCYCRVEIRAGVYYKKGKGICFYLNTVKKDRDFERFGRKKTDPSIFYDDIEDSGGLI